MNRLFSTIGLIARHSRPEVAQSLLQLAAHLDQQGLRVIIDRDTQQDPLLAASTYPQVERAQLGNCIDVAVVLGGDGTMLSVARHLAPHKVPLIGVNQGRLGFMTDIPLHEMQTTVSAILRGEHCPEERMLLSCTIVREGQQIAHSLALNDVVFSRGETGAMIEFEVFVDQQFVYSQRSDGLIVTTPTGSTAYSLAAGGPILHPTVPAIALVPICPQSLSNRPIAINDQSVVTVIMTRTQDARVHFDGQEHHTLQDLDQVVIQRYPNTMRFLHPLDYNYYDMLRHKLHWGERLL